MMSSIKDVASAAGVSISTVSNVINNTKYVSPKLQEKVNAAVALLNYEADSQARNLKTGITETIGIITADICGLFYPYVIKGIYETANNKNFSVMIFDAGVVGDHGSCYEREMECFKRLVMNKVDGIIFASSIEEDLADGFISNIVEMCSRRKQIPLVSIERDFSNLGIDSVFVDNVRGARQAVQHLLDVGCTKVCHIMGPEKAKVVQDRVQGYIKTMEENGYVVDKHRMIEKGDYTHQSGYLALKRLLESAPDLDGVFISNDQMAIGALKALQECKKRVPEDVRVVGFDNVFVSSIVEPSLSTIHIRKNHMGRNAADILFSRIEKNEPPSDIVKEELESRLVIRKSTMKDAAEDWILSEW